MFSLISALINGRVNTRETGDLRRHRAHYDVTVMYFRAQTDIAYIEGSLLYNPIWPRGGARLVYSLHGPR